MGGGRAGFFSIMLLLLVGIVTAQAQVVGPELQKALQAAPPEELFSVIVAFDREETIAAVAQEAGRRGGSEVARTLRSRSARAQGPVRALLHGRGKPFRDLWIINSLALEATPELIELLALRPEVTEIRSDVVLHLPDLQPAQAHTGFWNLEMVGAPELWDRGIDGEGIVIAVIDSGVDIGHPDLAQRWRGGANSWYDPYNDTNQPYDVDGHGTAVTGLIVGGDFSGTPIGVAPGARWIAAKVFRDDGTATVSVIHSAFQWALDPDGNPDTDDAPHVVNNSWGLGPAGTCNEEFRASIQALQAAGIVVVSAAGNNGPGASTGISPANYPEGLAVGAIDSDLNLAPFSSRGPGACDDFIFPEVTAPGVHVLSALAGSDGRVAPFFSGTSFAAPHLSGVLALLRQGFPEASTRLLEHAVVESAADLGPEGPDNGYGLGLIDASAAWSWLEAPPSLLITPYAGFVSFGSVAPGSEARREISFFNAGQEVLTLELISAPGPFSHVETNCPGNLLPDNECRATVRFAPELIGLFSGNLEVRGSAPGSVLLEGIGNTPPRPARLLFPDEGAVQETIVTFRWQTFPDPDGHATTDTLLVSRSIEFPDNLAGESQSPGRVVLAGAGALLLALGAALMLRRDGKRPGALFIAAVMLIIVSCGGGGDRPVDETAVSEVERELMPGDYFWKVLTEDELGEAVSSEVRTFTVR
jgi:serine protease AprX